MESDRHRSLIEKIVKADPVTILIRQNEAGHRLAGFRRRIARAVPPQAIDKPIHCRRKFRSFSPRVFGKALELFAQ